MNDARTGFRSPAEPAAPVPVRRRWSVWLLAAAMVLVIGLKSYPAYLGVPWPWLALAALLPRPGCWRGPRGPTAAGGRRTVLLAYLIVVLFFTRIDGDTGNAHVLELVLKLGVGVLVVPALAARHWLGEPLDYQWFPGRWSLKMWLWLPAGFVLAYGFMWLYFNV